jgi:hypothetical protein
VCREAKRIRLAIGEESASALVWEKKTTESMGGAESESVERKGEKSESEEP